jgi:positive regulator of sigma E activity
MSTIYIEETSNLKIEALVLLKPTTTMYVYTTLQFRVGGQQMWAL